MSIRYKMAGLLKSNWLKYFKRRCDTQRKEKLDTLPDPHGPLSKDIPSSSVGISYKYPRAPEEKKSLGLHILLTPA